MNLLDLRTELLARGFSYLDSTRANRYVNKAYTELCDEEQWSFLEASSSGASPLTISDLGDIESVVDSTNEVRLKPLERKLIEDYDPKINDTGNPYAYYITAGTIINAWPTTSVTLAVNYWKTSTELVNDSDIPIVPTRYQYLIVDSACRRAYQDSDRFDLAQGCDTEYQRGLGLMRDSLLVLSATDGPGQVRVSSGAGDW